MKNLFFLLLLAATAPAIGQHKLSIDDKGRALKDFYRGMQVETLWLSGQHVDWESGEPDRPGAEQDIHTHCSAFVASACKRLNTYILRPPEHKTLLLANAQFDWLASPEARNNGWAPIGGANIYEEAQRLANQGFIVVATYKNPDAKVPGHIALVTPHALTPEKIAESGPMLTMAGTHNWNLISLKAGFKSHIAEWPEHAILFYYNIHPPAIATR
ncbi:MAG: hypothetical protein Q8927_07185 [Bacteroidota bacterium]|nr:hypothetical protein [Bacteroidota bacterium]MDP4215969.1 hypothetical protein [Bacteroidota bacterium]MDP4245108.1 hypothetical protein [Bacteroidota bacterium]MDP4254422.1 hypothetical protein [Bacteroidota bacterium]MDP4257842.1 hypothetical protein [Bacteroidota bacterium]